MSEVIQMSTRQWKKIEATLEKLSKSQEEWISEEDAAAFLRIKVVSLRNKVYSKEIPETHYTTGSLGKRFYNKQKLMGLD